MKRIDVITQKELITPALLKNRIAVVIDVFLATSTIAFLLKNNYEPVYAKESLKSAAQFGKQLGEPHVLLGEDKANPVEGFLFIDPSLLEKTEEKKAAIITSTNGTIAIEGASVAHRLYISSLVNGHIVADHLRRENDEHSITLVCSGNDNDFSLEDFTGAGQIIHYLLEDNDYYLSDTARAALATFVYSKQCDFENLRHARTANLLRRKQVPNSVEFVLDHYENVNVLPVYEAGKIINGWSER